MKYSSCLKKDRDYVKNRFLKHLVKDVPQGRHIFYVQHLRGRSEAMIDGKDRIWWSDLVVDAMESFLAYRVKPEAFHRLFHRPLDRNNVGDFGSIWGFSKRYGVKEIVRLKGIMQRIHDRAIAKMEKDADDGDTVSTVLSDEASIASGDSTYDDDELKKIPDIFNTIEESAEVEAEIVAAEDSDVDA